MSSPWTPDHPVRREHLLAVLAAHRPHQPTAGLTPIGVGWDHAVWRCDDLVFRYPHQACSLDLAARRVGPLAALARRLPTTTPEPVFVAAPVLDHPGQCVAYQHIPGQMPARLGLSRADRVRAAEPLGAVLRCLHGQDLQDSVWEGVPTDARPGELALRAQNGRLRADQLAHTEYATLARQAADRMAAVPAETTELCLVHGDLHGGQLLFDETGALVGVIDWDELRVGDPAADLLLVYGFLPPEARGRFWSAYGEPVGAARARHMALSVGLAILAQAVDAGDVELAREAALGVEFALA